MLPNFELLDAATIYSVVGNDVSSRINHLEILESVNSTNTYLLTKPILQSGAICIAEHQTEGRGRRGRTWLSPASGNLYLSLAWDFLMDIGNLNGLALAVGVAVTEALNSYGISRIRLKWPNDIFFTHRKLAGILIEIAKSSKKSCHAVVGIGLNIFLPEEIANINQPWIDIYTIEKKAPDRNLIAGLILREVIIAFTLFQEQGLAAFHGRWRELDLLLGQKFCVQTPQGEIEGIGAGIDETGNLQLQRGTTLHRFNSGEVSVRFQPIASP